MNKSDLPKFLNFKNEKAAPGVELILHLGKPSFLAEVNSFNNENELKQYGEQVLAACEAAKFPFVGSTSRKPWNGKYYYFYVVRFFEVLAPGQKETDKLARVARRMADWYLYNVLNK